MVHLPGNPICFASLFDPLALWIIDSGATDHITAFDEQLSNSSSALSSIALLMGLAQLFHVLVHVH